MLTQIQTTVLTPISLSTLTRGQLTQLSAEVRRGERDTSYRTRFAIASVAASPTTYQHQ